jgi:hypothetical protein
MPTFGLIVEGVDDEAVYQVLASRCRPGVQLLIRKCRGKVIGKFLGFLTELDRRPERIEKVFIMADSDGRDPASLLRAITGKYRPAKYRSDVKPLIVVRELEAWLIADPAALKDVIGIEKRFRNPETIADPKAELRRLLTQRSAYTPELAKRIAERIDLDVLAQRCPRFALFRKALSPDKCLCRQRR